MVPERKAIPGPLLVQKILPGRGQKWPRQRRAYYRSTSRKLHLPDLWLRTTGRLRYRLEQLRLRVQAVERQLLLPVQHPKEAHRIHRKKRSHQDFHDLRNIVLSWFSILLKQIYYLALLTGIRHFCLPWMPGNTMGTHEEGAYGTTSSRRCVNLRVLLQIDFPSSSVMSCR